MSGEPLPSFEVARLERALEPALRAKIDAKTKPLGSLGRLEALALQIGLVQGTLEPKLEAPAIIVFAADHGVTAEGVSAYPREVTAQMVRNFLRGGAAINVLARLHGLELAIVDAGVDADLGDHPGLTKARIARGTRNFVHEPAMSEEQLARALATGAALVAERARRGSNVLGFGDMGIGNTSSAALLAALVLELPLEQCVGAGAGLDARGVERKVAVLERARGRILAAHPRLDAIAALGEAGGFELAMIAGAALAAAERRRLVLVDGFIATAALLAAARMAPAVLDYCVFSHCSGERGHRPLLERLGARPLLDLDLRLGEGTGAALAYPLLASAVAFLNEMASFGEAGVSEARRE